MPVYQPPTCSGPNIGIALSPNFGNGPRTRIAELPDIKWRPLGPGEKPELWPNEIIDEALDGPPSPHR
jgi:hypothetical protein